MSNSIVLDYHNSLLREDDINLLNENCWLNDNIIGFVFEYLEKEEYQDYSGDILFVNPSTTQLIKFFEVDEACSIVQALDLHNKKLVFLPVNDNDCDSAAGGSHWSLLVFNIPENKCYSYDSSGDLNQFASKTVFTKLNTCLSRLKLGTSRLIHRPSPQQTNGSDCGVYLICVAEDICRHYIHSDFSLDNFLSAVTPQFVEERRKDIKKLIHAIRER